MILRNLLKMAAALVGGLIAGVVLLLLLGIAIKAVADDAVRPARLGEQDRSLDYKEPETITIYVQVEDIGIASCKARNSELVATVQMIVDHMIARPESAHMWESALVSIHTMWCVE